MARRRRRKNKVTENVMENVPLNAGMGFGMPNEDDPYSDTAIITRATKNIEEWFNYWAPNIENYNSDMEFALGSQMAVYNKSLAISLAEPSLIFNKIYDYVRRVLGYQRDHTPAMQVHPVDQYADQKMISLRSSILRGIYHDSNAAAILQRVFECILMGGFGAFYVDTEYASPKTFNQVLRWKPILDPCCAFFDPLAKHPNKIDGRFSGYFEMISKAQFKHDYPDSDPSDSTWTAASNQYFKWGDEDLVTIAYYHEPQIEPMELYEVDMGIDKIEIFKDEYDADEDMKMFPITKRRQSARISVWCYKINQHQVLEKVKLTCKDLPVIFVAGHSTPLNGREITLSFIGNARDPQRLLNYIVNQLASYAQKTRREQFMGTPENVPTNDLKRIWSNAEERQGLLIAARDSSGALPTPIPPPEIPPTMMALYQKAEQDVDGAMGMYGAAKGADTSATSGIMYAQQAINGDGTTKIYFSNLQEAVATAGTVTVGWMKSIFDSTRYVATIDEKGKYATTLLNHGGDDSLDDGDYKVTIEASSPYALQKEVALKTLIEIANLPEPVIRMFGDLIGENLDLENTPQIVKRLQMFVDPNILAKEKGEPPPPPPPPTPQEQMMQAQIQAKQSEVASRMQGHQIDLMKMINAQKNEELKLQGTHAKTQAEVFKAEKSAEAEMIKANERLLGSLFKNSAANS